MRLALPFQHFSLAVVLALGLISTALAEPKTLRWSHQSDLVSLDPMASNDAFTVGVQGWFYEALTGFDQDLKLVPMLAESWEQSEPTKWVFHLRKGVSFHDGNHFTADDVLFSWQRSQSDGSAIKDAGAKATAVRKIDDYTIEVTTSRHNPILPRDWTQLPIMSKRWAEQKQAEQVASPHASLHENGTGPFMVVKRQPRGQTTLKRYPEYWHHNMPGNVDKIMFQPMKQASARISALLEGKMDIVMPVPLQSVPQLEKASGMRILSRPQARVLFISMDLQHSKLPYSSVSDKNPLKDKRVRQAISLAIDTQAISQNIMGGRAKPTGTLIAPQVNGYDASFSAPHRIDIDRARKLLLDAGYLDSFSIRLACPADHYADDQAICQAIADMLSAINIQVELATSPDAENGSENGIAPPQDAGLHLQSWAPATLDAGRVLYALVACRDSSTGAGRLNRGGYCNQEIDALTYKIGIEADHVRRNIMIREAFSMLRNDYSYLPLHQPPMVWGARADITLTPRADNTLDIRSVVMP
ncbi:ABC transporter substrate-binding protein [Pollutimonas harenae]|uniref:ABC transporter substrate-binding protein n=1 Tax=Pollutimonas harenae TaxID=657015 RepID=A0A853GN75_9BURK|nr:ABC transporter substrate-binding protein [Pollutimonas harenae]NYT84458.1 ABC transporter substrate-binding protein [Pollutimonas harenae]TEA73143.1 ABC transporter substrate-binding protein [Pollutimonas harenae]